MPDLRSAIRVLCQQFPAPYWREQDKNDGYPTEFVEMLTRGGFLSVLIPPEYGGGGLGIQAAGVILEEICRSGGHPGICHAQMYTMGTVLRHGSPSQKEKYLPAIAAGSIRLQAFGVTEPDAGSDTTSIETFAEKRGDQYLINGRKVWISRVAHSDLLLLLARTTRKPQVSRKTDGMSVFLIELKHALNNGLTVIPIESMINRHSTQLIFENLAIPVDSLVGEEGQGFACILDGMNAERILLAYEAIGDAYWFIERATDYAQKRVVFGKPIGQNQGIQFPLATAYAHTRAAALMVEQAARLFDDGQACGAEANMALLLAAEAQWEAAEACMQTHGGYAFAKDYDIERKYREARLYRIAPISTNLILAYLGEHVLGLPRSY